MAEISQTTRSKDDWGDALYSDQGGGSVKQPAERTFAVSCEYSFDVWWLDDSQVFSVFWGLHTCIIQNIPQPLQDKHLAASVSIVMTTVYGITGCVEKYSKRVRSSSVVPLTVIEGWQCYASLHVCKPINVYLHTKLPRYTRSKYYFIYADGLGAYSECMCIRMGMLRYCARSNEIKN